MIPLAIHSHLNAATEVLEIKLPDGEVAKGTFHLPTSPVKLLVFHLHGTGPNTYENPRKKANKANSEVYTFEGHNHDLIFNNGL